MKKVLFATTALIATAGMAAAEISFGGYGRFGMVYDDSQATETALDHRFRLTVTGVTESDNGVKFEGRIRWEANDGGFGTNSANAAAMGGAGFAVTSGGFRVDVGNASDVFDSGDIMSWGGTGVGYTGFLDQAANFSGFDKGGFGAGAKASQTVKLRYTASGFTGSASYNLVSAGVSYWQIGAAYSFGDHKVGAMYGDRDQGASNAQWAVGAGGSFGDISYSAIVADSDTQNGTAYAVSGSYSVSSATSLQAFIASGGVAANDTSYGIGAKHSLGGGVTLGAGIGSSAAGATMADAGVVFNF
ncbi:porin [Pseudopelagicola sp. nBUS_19]|uniref:porin n=1 Tax=Pseudopelagicola sp. nBUS_19 TaxID=3395316 RepID=UPI003EBC53AA